MLWWRAPTQRSLSPTSTRCEALLLLLLVLLLLLQEDASWRA
jgi:hypothetical protein